VETVINGVRLYYREEGMRGAPPVVLVHGFPFSHAMWEPQIQALKGGYRVVAYDVRGLGRSGSGGGQATMDLLVDDLLGLMDHLGLGAAVLAGLSMGGYIALRAVEREPARVKALILADTRSEADGDEARRQRAAAIEDIEKRGLAGFAERFQKSVLAPASWSGPKPCVAAVAAMILGNDPVGVCTAARAILSRRSTTSVLSGIKVPALVLVGADDALTPPDCARSLAQAIPGAELAVIPEAGHLSSLENPREFNRLLLDFLRRVPR